MSYERSSRIALCWVAHASRVLVSASRGNRLFQSRTQRKVRDGETPSPARGTRALPDRFSWADLLQETPIYSARLPFFSGQELLLQVERQLPIPVNVGAPDHQVDSALNCIATVFRIVAIAVR